MHTEIRGDHRVSQAATQQPTVLVVDDDTALRLSVGRALAPRCEVRTAETAAEALTAIRAGGVAAVVADVVMPGSSGLDLLREVRNLDSQLPVILMTGRPTIDSAATAVELQAFRYITKPFEMSTIRAAVDSALRARALATMADPAGDRAALELKLRGAIETLWMAYQPIVNADSRSVLGYEALMRTRSTELPHPGAVLEAAEKLGALHELGRAIRERVAWDIARAPRDQLFFVNLHAADLADPELYSATAPLSKHARRVVLEITERASLESVSDVGQRIADLRAQRFRIAVDDLGAGYAGLSYFASLQPDIAKIDMSLVRGIDRDPIRQRVVLSLAALARTLGIETVAEGVETTLERDTLVRLGCTHLQGYCLARPGPPFPSPTWS